MILKTMQGYYLNMNQTENHKIIRISGIKKETLEDTIITEVPLTIILNNEELVTIICTPIEIPYLAIGYLYSERFIQIKEDIKDIIFDEKQGILRVETDKKIDPIKDLRNTRFITPGCVGEASIYRASEAIICEKIESHMQISFQDVVRLLEDVQKRSLLYRETGGVHHAALCNREDVLIFSEDIGRHNALDKIIGRCIMHDIPTENKIIITSGRVSSDVTLKIVKAHFPILISRSAPTSESVKLAERFGVTLIGFARGKRMNIYSNVWRITF